MATREWMPPILPSKMKPAALWLAFSLGIPRCLAPGPATNADEIISTSPSVQRKGRVFIPINARPVYAECNLDGIRNEHPARRRIVWWLPQITTTFIVLPAFASAFDDPSLPIVKGLWSNFAPRAPSTPLPLTSYSSHQHSSHT